LRCTGAAPLTVTFVPIGEGVATVRWSFACGDMGVCRQLTPTVTFDQPNQYQITLSVAGINGSTATATAEVEVTPGSTGAVCDEPADCDLNGGLECLCPDGKCPGALSLGLCTRACASTGCALGEVCADLSRGVPTAAPDGGADDGGVPADDWRAALCLPACVQSSDCARGFVCRDLPSPGAGAFSWRRGCFADLLGDVGASCAAPDGSPDPGNCLSGRCDPLGARGVCTADCSPTMLCPSNASCLQFNDASASQCLARCDASHPCGDSLLACTGPRAGATFGFAAPIGDPAGTTYCVPKACSGPSDCAPAGTCTLGFCTR
jgi:PKD repeat protein